eukprot:CAMPEP_0175139734 /NCGR_PEP_ID=MMETSP0087-20121206/11078_1 /TAXON_ID=136419 /ORGANISM="Unknown Unknown, Strain D1" /LENGTH=252 /DNA_ID=CAMNT_0016422799 /DNA_START=55 /DNA_END=813 /DNA_ORIENTATION=-
MSSSRFLRSLCALRPVVSSSAPARVLFSSVHTPQFTVPLSHGFRRFHASRSFFSEEAKKEEPTTEAASEQETAEEKKVDEKEVDYKKLCEEKEEAAKEANERLLRTLADMQNLRDRSKREIENAAKYSAGEMAKVLLEVSDNLNLALKAAAEEANDSNPQLKSFYEGVQMTEKTLMKCFEKFGIVKMKVEGEKFDPNLHDCLFEYADTNAKPGSVGQLIKDGYMIKDRVLRAAQVGAVKGVWVDPEPEEKKE